MKKQIMAVVGIMVLLGGGYFVSLHISREKPKTEEDREIERLLNQAPHNKSINQEEKEGMEPEEVISNTSATETKISPELKVLKTSKLDPEAEGSDPLHQGSGEVSIVEFQDQKKVVFGEDFKVSNAPDLMVYLTKEGSVPKTNETFKAQKETAHNLGEMQQFSGYQTFNIPADLDISSVRGLVIWCEQFGQFMSAAEF